MRRLGPTLMNTAPTIASNQRVAEHRPVGREVERDPRASPSSGGISAGIARVVQKAMSIAAAHAHVGDDQRLGDEDAKDTHPRGAGDCRTAISRARPTARASIRFATFP